LRRESPYDGSSTAQTIGKRSAPHHIRSRDATILFFATTNSGVAKRRFTTPLTDSIALAILGAADALA
jgi:hypothetical protein